MQVVILAAGMGSRYQGLKQLDTFGPSENTLMEFSIHDALKGGFDEVLFIIRRDFELEFRRFIDERYEASFKYDVVFQELNFLPQGLEAASFNQFRVKPWGTAHALFCAKDKIKGDFLIINADDFYGFSSYEAAFCFLKEPHRRNGIVSYQLDQTLSEHGFVSRGVCRMNELGSLLRIDEIKKIRKKQNGDIVYLEGDEEKRLSKEDKVSMNMFAFRHECLEYLEEYLASFFESNGRKEGAESYLTEFIDYLILKKSCCFDVLDGKGKWFGVTYKEDREFVSQEIRNLLEKGNYFRV